MDEACVGAERDQLILRKQTMAVKDGTVIRGIELSLDLCGTAQRIFATTGKSSGKSGTLIKFRSEQISRSA